MDPEVFRVPDGLPDRNLRMAPEVGCCRRMGAVTLLELHQPFDFFTGTVLYNARISLQISCPMNLIDFPVDVQTCHMNIESYGYDVRHIVFKWEDRKQNVSIDEKVSFFFFCQVS